MQQDISPNVEELFNRGLAAHQQQLYEQAANLYKQVLAIQPNLIAAINNLGTVYEALQQHEFALEHYHNAVKLDPQFFDGYYNLGKCHNQLGDKQLAIKAYEQAIQIDPNKANAHLNLGNVYFSLRNFTAATNAYLTVLNLIPNHTNAMLQMAHCYLELKEYAKAITFFQGVLKAEPNNNRALANLYFTYRHICDWKNSVRILDKLDASTQQALHDNKDIYESPLINITRSLDQTLNLAVAANIANQIATKVQQHKINFSYPNSLKNINERKIKIGYISNDFYSHATLYLMQGIFRNHDLSRFEVFYYSYSEKTEFAHEYIDIYHLNHIEAAKRINQDQIDILIELKGHTQGSRLEIMALRPAPIQVSYLGFPGTTGANYIDYIITDEIVSPPSEQIHYTERLLYLDPCYQANDNSDLPLPSPPARAAENLPQDAIVYCSFNQYYKFTAELFSLWMSILKNVPNSILWLLQSNELAMQNIMQFANDHGVDSSRIIFAKQVPHSEHQQRLQLADVCLDTYFYNGHTTSSEILKAGVPIITMQGGHFASRVSASLLSSLELTEFICENEIYYKQLAITLGKNPENLQAVKARIKQKIESSNVYNPKYLCKNLEDNLQLIAVSHRRL